MPASADAVDANPQRMNTARATRAVSAPTCSRRRVVFFQGGCYRCERVPRARTRLSRHGVRDGEAMTRLRVCESPSAAIRLREARAFVDQFPPGDEVLLVGASRGAVDDFARAIAMEKGATFGLHRLSFTQLAARLAAAEIASRGRAPASGLGHEAVAARAAFETTRDEALEYFAPVSGTPGFPKALARTLLELRLAGVTSTALGALTRSGRDLAELLDRVDELMADAATSDRASLFATATNALSPHPSALTGVGWPSMPTLLLDVPFDSDTESEFLWALIEQAPSALMTIPSGDARALARLARRNVTIESIGTEGNTDLDRLTRHLFSSESPAERKPSRELTWFSAPGEGRECIEVARRMLKEAGNGVRFDEMAVLIRSPQQYIGVLEHALSRAGIPAYFDRGIRRPHPAGRAFLAILGCAVENLSARRFAEYLSLGQVPAMASEEARNAFFTPRDEMFGSLAEPNEDSRDSVQNESQIPNPESRQDSDPAAAIVSGTLRAPWRWESLLVESAVIGGADRWSRRLNGLSEQYPPPDPRASSRRTGLPAHSSPRARAPESRPSPCVCASARRNNRLLARNGDLG